MELILMSFDAARGRKSRTAKPPERQAAETVKASIRLTVEAWKLLGHYAVEERRDRSELLEAIIFQHLGGRFVVHDHDKGRRIPPPGEAAKGRAGGGEDEAAAKGAA